MKKTLVRFFTCGGIALTMLASCKKNDSIIKSTSGTAGSLTASATTLTLTKADSANQAVSFTFSQAAYGYSAGITNTLEIDTAGDNFAHAKQIGLTNNTLSLAYSTYSLNMMLLNNFGVVPGKTANVQVRVMQTNATTTPAPIAPLYTNVVNLSVTTFVVKVPAAWVYVPGDYEGWGNPGAQEDSLISVKSNGIYTGIVDFTGYAGSTGTLQFKIVPVKGSWNVAYGSTTGSSISTSGGNITAPSAARYIVTVNLNTLTITMTPADYYSVTGDAATGWGNDTFMKYINDGNDNWVVTLPLASTGAFKIREDAQWTNSWGLSSTAGVLTDSNGGNISIPTTGNYIVSFNMAPSAYGSGPVATAAYTVTAK